LNVTKVIPMKKAKKNTATPKKQIKQKKHSQQFLKIYWPYLPLFILVFFGLTFGYNWQTTNTARINSTGVLAYATEMNIGGLLSATNTQRSQNGGLQALSLNSKLSSAAQTKANDMVARNYWSHTTPDGKEPWTFVDAAGYLYQKAGENLAYGFSTPSETVIGWMNSPSHRANILDTTYKEVGFGFANSSSYVGTGEETIVVAMYGNPSSATPVSAATPTPNTTPVAAPAQKTTTQTPATEQSPASQPTKEDATVPAPEASDSKPAETSEQANTEAMPITSATAIPASQPTTRITKLQSITAGAAPWSAAVLSGFLVTVVGLWVLKHAYAVKKVFIDGEKYLLHHPLIDVAVLMIVAAAILLSQSSGVVK
jgi:hypothetical protein